MRRYTRMKPLQVLVLCAFLFALPVGLHSQPSGSAPDEAGFALLVDVSDYRDVNIKPLKSKSQDVYMIRDALHSAGGFPEGQIQVLAGESATREGIAEALTAALGRAVPSGARFLFYLKGRSLNIGDETYFLPYDARVGAVSTYIAESQLADWLNQIQFRKVLIQATWDVDEPNDVGFSSRLAEILSSADTDADGNRNVTLAEVEAEIGALGFTADGPIRIVGNGSTVLLRLPSALEVTSEPSGASILLDGVEMGTTPARLTGLAPGKHTLLVSSDLHQTQEERTVEITAARGQRVIVSPYQFTPIGVRGVVDGMNADVMKGVKVRILGTGYLQDVAEGGQFSFQNWQAYGLLEKGKTYQVVAESSDGLYSGSASFTFDGTADIQLDISLAQRNWVKLAAQRLAAGDSAGAMAMFDTKLGEPGDGKDVLLGDETLADMTNQLAMAFLSHLEGKLQAEPGNLRWHVVAAQLADLTVNFPAAKVHWKVVKANASKESEEYQQAALRLRELTRGRRIMLFALLVAGAVLLVAVGFYMQYRIRRNRFREIPQPYISGKPISEKGMFFGRADVFDFIREKFRRDAKDITIVLHGGRRTGKTSILYQINNGRLGADFVPVFIDIQEMAGVDTHDFFRNIAGKVRTAIKGSIKMSEAEAGELNESYQHLEDKTRSAYQGFNDFLTCATTQIKDKYIIFLIDEYEILEEKVNKGALTDEIFSYLRHLMQNMGNLAFIFSGSSDFAKRDRKEWALMFNMAQPREVSFLKPDDARSLITQPVKEFMRYDRRAVELILRLTAGQPYFIQAMCANIIENLNERRQNRVTVAHVQEARDDLVENPPPHVAYTWSEMTADEKIMVALLAEALDDEGAYATTDDVLSRMSHYDLQYDRADISKAMARLQEEHLIERKNDTESYRFRMDLTRSWIQAEHATWGVLKEVQKP